MMSGSAWAAQPPTPVHGQEGQDAPWVVTPQELVDTMLDMAAVQPGERLLDLGSGDGRVVITAAQRGLHAVGVELGRGNARYPHLRAAVADRGELLRECLDEPLDGRVVGLVDCGVGGGLRPQPQHAVDARV